MLHFIIETFDTSLKFAVGFQRLMSSLLIEEIQKKSSKKDLSQALIRSGDDVYLSLDNKSCNLKKINISIATQSTNSSLIHFGVNIDTKGTPVPTSCLKDFELDTKEFALSYMKRVVDEFNSIVMATRKVRCLR